MERIDKTWVSAQHPSPASWTEDLEKLETAPWEVRSKGYDLVLMATSSAPAAFGIHRQDIQERLFKALGLSEEQLRRRFGFSSTPSPMARRLHGGIALGIDRVVNAPRRRNLHSRSHRLRQNHQGPGFNGRSALRSR